MNIKFFTVLFVILLVFVSWVSGWALCDKRASLFRIERSKNKNIVQYDACLLKNNNISDSNPVEAYWVLENGKREELSMVESKQAYGIESKEKLGENKFRIALAALKDREIVVEKIKGNYRAVVKINGESSILERVSVKSEEQALGLPKVQYLEVFGRNLKTNKSVKERITPKT